MRNYLQIEHASKIYGGSAGRVVAVDNCSMQIERDQFAVIVGPSGCGKTTLLNTIAGFEDLTSGSISIGGREIASATKRCRPGPDRMVVFQQGGLFPWMTALENVAYGPVARGLMTRADADRVAMEMLKRLNLRDVATQYPGEMSSGIRRVVELARVMVAKPEVLLMDEPFRALDALTKTRVQQFLLRLYDETPHTILFITHDLVEALFLGDVAFVMTSRPGRVKEVIRIDLPRPRTLETLSSARFLELKSQLTESLHGEAIRAFELGEKEAAR